MKHDEDTYTKALHPGIQSSVCPKNQHLSPSDAPSLLVILMVMMQLHFRKFCTLDRKEAFMEKARLIRAALKVLKCKEGQGQG